MPLSPSVTNAFHADHAACLCASYRRWTGKDLVVASSDRSLAESLYRSAEVVLSHDTSPDPLFNYANLAGQELFEMDWAKVITTPSRFSAEPVNREERARLMTTVSEQGYIDNYRGVRISATGKRFLIERATVWNVLNESKELIGQAATFDHWIPL